MNLISGKLKNDKEHIKVLTTLSLAASDTRRDTLTSIIISSLYQNPAGKEDLLNQIIEQFDFEPYSSELYTLLDDLIEINRIYIDSGMYKLSEDEKLKYQDLELELQDKDKQRFQNFKNFVLDDLGEQLSTTEIKLIWGAFVEYLYNNFYEFGEEAFHRFHPHLEYKGNLNNDEDFFNHASKKLKNKNLFKVFKKAVEKFPEFASSDDLDFLVDLAQKTICFTSLGIDPKIAGDDSNQSIIDWVLYLDTNVLYSLLNLHSHPENEACVALMEIISNNPDRLKIALRYSELTKKELWAKKDDFQMIDENLPDSAIKALLKSEDVDDFTRQYYSSLIADRDSTLHPSKVIELGPQTMLKKYKIDISRNKKRLEQIGEEYLNIKIQDYRRFINDKNLVREEFSEKKGTYLRPIIKSDKQITHDISLREVILHQRSSVLKTGTEATINSVKYFGLTLDALLLKFDANKVKDYNDEHSFPIFFKPSYLLSKLVRLLPIKTNNYKRAFIKAVTTKGFNKDPQKSHDILRLVNYLKKQGIDDEMVIYNLISKDLFLETYNKKRKDPEFDESHFIESELNKEFKLRQEELEKTKNALKVKEEDLISKDQENITLKKQTSILHGKKEQLETDVSIYEKSITKLKGDVKKLEKAIEVPTSQSQINFDAGSERKVVDKLKKQLKREVEAKIRRYKKKELKRWQNRFWLNLFWFIPITIGCLWLVFLNPNLEFLQTDTVAVRITAGIITLALDGFFLKLLHSRFDENNKSKRMENTDVPDYLSKELAELED
jgi:hypothetical protein